MIQNPSILILDSRPDSDVGRLTHEIDCRGLQHSVVKDIFDALDRIPHIEDRGIIIRGYLDGDTCSSKLAQSLETLFPKKGKELASVLKTKSPSPGVIFLRAFIGYRLANTGSDIPVSMMFNSGPSSTNASLKAAINEPMNPPDPLPIISGMRIFQVPGDPLRIRERMDSQDDPDTLKAFLDSLQEA